MPMSVGLESTNAMVDRMREIFTEYPEVETVVSQHGRPDDGTDATGFFNAEFFVPLKPFDTWPKGVDKPSLTKMINDRLQGEFPGVDFNFSQYIEDNVEEAASGVKGENSVKLFGNDLKLLEKTAGQIKDAMADVPGIADLAIFRLARPADRADRYRPREGRALRAAAGRHQRHPAGRHRRPGRGQPVRAGQRPELPDHGPPRPEYRTSLDAIRRIPIGAQSPERVGGDADPAVRCGRGEAGQRRRRSSIARVWSATSRSSSASAAATSAAR